MTTIVYKDGILATDSRLSMDGTLISDSNIKAVKSKKYLVAASGLAGLCDLFLEWGRNDFEDIYKPEVQTHVEIGDFEGIAIDKKGNVTSYDLNWMPTIIGQVEMYVSGSGGDVARGAMMMGADVITAIECAIKVDMNSGGPIQVFEFKKASKKLNKPKRKPKKVAKRKLQLVAKNKKKNAR